MQNNLKKILVFMLAMLILIACTACNNSESANSNETQNNTVGNDTSSERPDDTDTPSAPSTDGDTESEVLIVYFSNTGNTHKLTEMITAEYEADTLRLTPADPYEWKTSLSVRRMS